MTIKVDEMEVRYRRAEGFVRDVLHLDAERRELLIQTYGRTR